MQSHAGRLKREGRTIAFVPTMGFLHEGHLSLMRAGRERADILAASIFVNPTQFAPGEDFEAYPRDMQRDLTMATSVGVDVVFTPDNAMMYAEGFQTYVNLEKLPRGLCGTSRPIFFRGVATVVAKLFNIVRPDIAVFGEKDFQQLVVIRRMVQDLDFGIEIVGSPTVREEDGLAMSSRNAYLDEAERASAPALYECLRGIENQLLAGSRDFDALENAAKESLATAGLDPEYVAVRSAEDLASPGSNCTKFVVLAAAQLGQARLIDNVVVDA